MRKDLRKIFNAKNLKEAIENFKYFNKQAHVRKKIKLDKFKKN